MIGHRMTLCVSVWNGLPKELGEGKVLWNYTGPALAMLSSGFNISNISILFVLFKSASSPE